MGVFIHNLRDCNEFDFGKTKLVYLHFVACLMLIITVNFSNLNSNNIQWDFCFSKKLSFVFLSPLMCFHFKKHSFLKKAQTKVY